MVDSANSRLTDVFQGLVFDKVMRTVAAVREILRDALQLGERADALGERSPLFGAIPEFDSMAVVTVITLIEEEFDIVIHDDEITAEVFMTIDSLADFVDRKVEV